MPDPTDTKKDDGPFERLPRGRHKLSREEVESDQRERIMRAMSESVGEIGYVKTTVAHVLKRAGVSRDTFYSQFADKHDCFMASFERAADEMVNRMQSAVDRLDETDGSLEERVSLILASFLGLVAEEPDIARTYYVEVYAAGQDAIEHRVEIQLRTVELMQGMLEIKPEDRFAIQATMAAIGAVITQVVSLGQAENAVYLQKDLLKFVLAALRGIDPELF